MATRHWVIGTAVDCDICVTDPYASARHALIERDDATGVVTVADLGSTNGTWVERARSRWPVTAPTPIRPGDVVIVGRTRIPWGHTNVSEPV